MGKICVNCDKELTNPYELYINHHPKLVKWMRDAGYRSFIPQGADFYLVHKKIFSRKESDIDGQIDIGKQYKNCYIYYWASHSNYERTTILTAKDAYNLDDTHNRNDGFTQCDNKGRFSFSLKNPQPYKEGSRFYPSHMHFVIAHEDSEAFLPKLGTYNIPNELLTSDVEKDNTSVLINALPAEYYGRIHIPNSYSIPYNMNDKDIDKQLNEIIRLHYPEHSRRLSGNMTTMELPVTVYCHNPKCDAAKKLMKRLYSHKVLNIAHYSGGIKEWFNGKNV